MPPTEKTHTAEAKQEATHTPTLDRYKLVNGQQPGDVYLCRDNESCTPVAKFSRSFVTVEEAQEITEAVNSHAALLARNESLTAANEGMREQLTGAADELGNMLFRFDTVVEALRQAVMVGGHPLTPSEATEKANAMLAVAAPSRAKLAELNAALALPPMEGRE